MKNPVPAPMAIVLVVAVVAVVAFLFFKGVNAEPKTPRPDPSMFAPKVQGSTGGSLPTTQ